MSKSGLAVLACGLGWLSCSGCTDPTSPPDSVLSGDGGTVLGPDGLRLVLPEGALAAQAKVKIRRADLVPEAFETLGAVYQIEPLDQTLARDAVLFMPFDATAFWGDAWDVQVWKKGAEEDRWAPLPTRHDRDAKTSSVRLESFGYVALGTSAFECTPMCEGRECGPDGCGGECAPGCGTTGFACRSDIGSCECLPDCEGRECGPDGCGGECGAGCGSDPCNEEMGICLHSCSDGECDLGETPGLCPADCPTTTALDLLFVVDDSNCMTNEQHELSLAMSQWPSILTNIVGAEVDLHVGVTTTDLGSAPYDVFGCEQSNNGELMTSQCYDHVSGRFVVDAAPLGCSATRDATGWCVSHSCTDAHCGHETGSVITLDAEGCPRCRNFTGTLEETLVNLIHVGTYGCGFEQPLEAMRLALDNHPTNVGFLREDAVLAVVVASDEDDCSTSSPEIFGPDSEELGPASAHRCFEHGVTCDVSGWYDIGPRYFCRPRDDEGALLYPIDRYVSFLRALKPAGRLSFTVLGGPVDDGAVTVTTDEYGLPTLGFACSGDEMPALPGIRLDAVARALNAPGDLRWAYRRICRAPYYDFTDALAARLALMLGP